VHEHFSHFFALYGYWFIAGLIAVERVGIPVPGETVLIAAGIIASRTHNLNIELVVLCACAAVIVGNAAGYWLGQTLGSPLLTRFGHYVGLTGPRLRLGQYIFRKHGIKVVIFGQFFPVLRELAAILAGANTIGWRRFMIANVAGAAAWSSAFGFGAYFLGRGAQHTARSINITLGILAALVVVFLFFYLRRNEERLQRKADEELGSETPAAGAPSEPQFLLKRSPTLPA
jgi:membrane protein DedA with SNARE-associated domain